MKESQGQYILKTERRKKICVIISMIYCILVTPLTNISWSILTVMLILVSKYNFDYSDLRQLVLRMLSHWARVIVNFFFNFVIMGFNGNLPRKTTLFIYIFYITLSTLYGNCHEMDRLWCFGRDRFPMSLTP